MGRREWEDSLKVDRDKLEWARIDNNGSSWVEREQTERLYKQVDKASQLLQGLPGAQLDFLDGNLESACERMYFQIKGDNLKPPADVGASYGTLREQRMGVFL
jgi:hypothetical protein